ncbi:MAG: ABC transporter substrate-binding protein [Gammaproteobacteria bacterium]|nr:ABC transporter substrate-binding protein [Gammaproteobacteria bacterium]NIR85059.1 ABC transporter substrate-binding protein [Gammaproteobacteria bacterium]NIR88326.1 ABC transporter substrate-binding protein [Gammaproteobacteria bacterium]NIU06106.1 ABC transporter substrate-binding protein [Gammaproteobacteria bacterium]NIV73525.1 ABC transporter substrate-binding protein [Gammaproteobacteria bacterium]
MRTKISLLKAIIGRGLLFLGAGVVWLGLAMPAEAAMKPSELKVAVVHFLSGAGAPHDEAAVNAARLLTEQFNKENGIGGVKLNTIYVDEAGSTADKVAEFRRLVQDEKVDVVLGYTSSAHCLGVAPVAEELKTLTIFPICANYRLFEQQRYRYVFRTSAHAASENIAAAYYVLQRNPDLKTIAGLNYDYAYGRDSWEMFKEAILKLKPDVEVTGELWTKFLATDYSAEISRLLAAKPDVIHTVNWGAGLTAFIREARTRGLFNQSLVVATTGLLDQAEMMPPGVAFSGRGYHLQSPDPGKDPLNRRFIESYRDMFGTLPDYTGHFMAQGFYGLKAAYEKAIEVKGGEWPTPEEVITVFTNLGFETPRGPVVVRADHQAVHEAMWGLTTGEVDPKFGYPVLEQMQVFPATQVNAPLDVNPVDWIKSWPARGQ